MIEIPMRFNVSRASASRFVMVVLSAMLILGPVTRPADAGRRGKALELYYEGVEAYRNGDFERSGDLWIALTVGGQPDDVNFPLGQRPSVHGRTLRTAPTIRIGRQAMPKGVGGNEFAVCARGRVVELVDHDH